MSRRKGTPCACECDPCKGKNNIRTINNASPDPNGDFIIEEGAGIGIEEIQYGIKISNLTDPDSLVAGTNIVLTQVGTQMEIAVSDDISIGNLNVAGNIIQQGSAYETHAEQIYTTDDYIIMRDDAVGGLASGSYSGFQVKKYDGTNDGRLVIDNSGTARVGDVGEEQPLMTRDESADLTDGECLVWDAVNSKAVTEAIPNAINTEITNINTALSGKGVINTVTTADGTNTAVSGSLTDMRSVSAPADGIYLIVARWDMSTNPNTSQTYSAQVKIGSSYVNLFAGHYSTDSYARGTYSYISYLSQGTTVGFALYQNLGSNQSCYNSISIVRLD